MKGKCLTILLSDVGAPVTAAVQLRNYRTVAKSAEAHEQAEGDGARVTRYIGTSSTPQLDPFLLLDAARVKFPNGFPDHPHRGFETVTYLLEGSFTHEDFTGGYGVLNEGDYQWMSAGRGVVHAEMPSNNSQESVGLQLWINLRAKDKLIEPAYQTFNGADVATAKGDGVTVRILAGECMGVKSPVFTRTPAMYLDVRLTKTGAELDQPVPPGWNAFAVILEGSVVIEGGARASRRQVVIFTTAEPRVKFVNKDDIPARVILIAGEPLNEPIARRGPFVMNTEAELQAAFEDYHQAKNGFEKKIGFKSRALKAREAARGK